jgi:hypothetical protein
MEEDMTEEEETSCASCLEEIIPGEDVVLAHVVHPLGSEDGSEFLGLEIVLSDEQEPLYPPLFHCIPCFEELAGQLNMLNKDRPPLPIGDAAVTCDYCGSGIPFLESCVRFDHGELVQSKKTGLMKFLEAVNASPLTMCLSCAIQLTGALDEEDCDLGELWPDLSNADECPQCTLARCWQGTVCHCDCHKE